jgi:3-phosphoshikimate 1-carboxyvinyltransferase
MLPDPYPIRPWTAPCRGTVSVPGSKSLTNRALLLGALSGESIRLTGALFSRDSLLLADGLRALGFSVRQDPENALFEIRGCGGRIPSREARVDVGNAGTVARFLTAFACLAPEGNYSFDGDPEMRKRPMQGLIEVLERAGARFNFHQQPYCFPFTVRPSGLNGGTWSLDASASSQMVSALMLVAPYANEPVRIEAREVRPAFVRMTESLMRRFGVDVDGDPLKGYRIPAGVYRSSHPRFPIEPDASAASYFMALPLLLGGEVLVRGMHAGMLQGDTAFAGVLRALGTVITDRPDGWLVRSGPIPGKATSEFSFETFSDTFLTLAAVAPFLPEPVAISGIAHTRHQECDRPAAMAAGLRLVGTRVEEDPDRLAIFPLSPGEHRWERDHVVISTYRDHRVAMSFALAGCRDRRGDGRPWLSIADPECCSKTFPGFFSELDKLYQQSHDQ